MKYLLTITRNKRSPSREFNASSRTDLFAEIDRPRLAPLPDQPYVFARWKRCRVAPDYHIEIDGHWYSTPYRLIRELIDVRIADKTVEIFHKGQRIASHARAPNRRGHTTIADHMPSAHRRYGKWNCPPERRASSGRWVRRSQMLDYDLIVGIVGLAKSRSEVRYMGPLTRNLTCGNARIKTSGIAISRSFEMQSSLFGRATDLSPL